VGGRDGPAPLPVFCKWEAGSWALAYAGSGRTARSLAVGRPAAGASELAATEAPHFVRHLRGGQATVTWGSFNVAGPTHCWSGHAVARRFEGQLSSMQLFPHALSSAKISALAAQP